MIDSTLHRRRILAGGAALVSSMVFRTSRAAEQTHQSAASLVDRLREYLWRSQLEDGRWASSTYAVLRSGQALTPFVLFALIQSDPKAAESERARRSLQWIRGQLRHGVLGIADPDVLEYPVFSTAFAMRCFQRMQCSDDQAMLGEMRRFLIDQQFTETRGFDPSHLAYGGWGFGGDHPPGQTGHMDLSHVRWVLSALEETASRDDHESTYQPNAQRFLRLVQKNANEDRTQPLGEGRVSSHSCFDGGFYFSPIVLAANKGRVQRDSDRACFRSYATATCDGVLALSAAGVDQDDARIVAAKQWLMKNPSWDHPAGIPIEHPEPWGDAVYFYHQASRAEAYDRFNVDGNWPNLLVSRLSKHQQPDGSFQNQLSSLMKEDDPILCSSLALIALSHAIRSL